MKLNLSLGVALVAVVIAIGSLVREPKVVQILGADPGPVKTETQDFQRGYSVSGYQATSSSVATYVLTANDLAPGGFLLDTIAFAKSGVLATTTWTFPASSTMSRVLPRAGMRSEQCLYVATGTSWGLILAAGTGIDFQTSSTSPADLTIMGGHTACYKVIRQPDTDISVLIDEYMIAD